MKKLLATSAILATALISTDATAANTNFPYWYLGLSGGVADQSDSDIHDSSAEIEWDTGYVVSASLGYQNPSLAGFRPEVEYSYRKQDFQGGDDSQVHVVAANLYYDFRNASPITPYVGGGLGLGNFKINSDGPGPDGSDTQAIYQGMVGIGYEPANLHNVGLSLQYRYMAPFSEPETDAGFEYEYDNHSIEAGLKFRF